MVRIARQETKKTLFSNNEEKALKRISLLIAQAPKRLVAYLRRHGIPVRARTSCQGINRQTVTGHQPEQPGL